MLDDLPFYFILSLDSNLCLNEFKVSFFKVYRDKHEYDPDLFFL